MAKENKMKTKIVLLPLDERPCNYNFPAELFSHEDLEIIRPEKLGFKKKAADRNQIRNFLERECRDADGLVLSADMLLYGGLVPSRIHHDEEEKLEKWLTVLTDIRKKNSKLIVYAFQVIMRCPSYSSSDEEPDYYEFCGEQIHKTGEIIHKSRLGISSGLGVQELMPQVPAEALDDYISRRQINKRMNERVLEYVERGDIDFLVIPQDDSAMYGYAAMDQEAVYGEVLRRGLSDRVVMYPGADEGGMTLVSRMLNQIYGKKPKIYVKYASEKSKYMVPLYEGNSLSATVKSHVSASGGQLTEGWENADMIIALTAPADHMQEATVQPSRLPEYRAERNLSEMVDFIKDRLKEGKTVTVADNAYANGGELEFFKMLDRSGLLLLLDGYAGWNTSANTLGTALAEGIDALLYGKRRGHQDFLVKRYLEDVGYCSVVRGTVAEKLQKTEWNYFDVGEQRGDVAEMVAEGLRHFIKEECSSIAEKIWLDDIYMPWKRMFETGFRAGIKEDRDEEDQSAG